jgi:membrane protease YdiL (CAAX protease family)
MKSSETRPDAPGSTSEPAPRAFDLRGIIWYVLIAYGLTFAADLYMLGAGVRFDQMPAWATLALAVTMLFPALSAFIVRKWITREGFASAGIRFGSWKPYVATWLAVPVLFALAYGLSVLFGSARFDPELKAMTEQLNALSALSGKPAPPAQTYALIVLVASLTVAPIITGIFTFGEEFGWTGYLLPKLLPLGKWRAALIYGIIWGLWHAPVIYGGYNYPGYPILGIFLMCIFTTVVGLWQAALRLRSNSVVLTTWFHALINTQGRGVLAMYIVGVHPIFGGFLGLPGLVLMGITGAWLLARTPEDVKP